jgi:UDP-N-acetylglucosamine 4,6-dehydratase
MIDAEATYTDGNEAGFRLLITGATGSLGHAVLERLDAWAAACGGDSKRRSVRVFMLARNEYQLWQTQLRFRSHGLALQPILGDVRDAERMAQVLWEYGITHVLHLAAIKRVESAAAHPGEVFKTNVEGTRVVLDAVVACDVTQLVVLSSDKAVDPTTVYGESKAEMEALVRSAMRQEDRRLVLQVVRPGNLFGSKGSVIELFAQLAEDQPLPVHDPEMTRFAMPMSAIADQLLVLLGLGSDPTGAIGELVGSSGLWVPKARSFLLRDLANLMQGDSGWEVTEPRGGEKRHEQLMNASEFVAARNLPEGWWLDASDWNVADPDEVEGMEMETVRSDQREWRLSLAELSNWLEDWRQGRPIAWTIGSPEKKSESETQGSGSGS